MSRVSTVQGVVRRTAAPLGAATLVSQLNSIVILLALAHAGTLEMVADYRVTLSAVAIATIVALPGAATAVSRSAARGHDVAVAIARRRLPWALLGAGGLAATGAALTIFGSRSTGLSILAASLVFVPWTVSDLAGAYLIGARCFGRFLRLQIVVQTATAAWIGAALLVVPDVTWPLVLGYFGLTAVVQLVVLARLPRRHEPEALRECHGYSKSLSRIGILSQIDLQLDVLLTAVLLAPADVALLAVARTGAQFFKSIWYLVAQANIGRLAALDLGASRTASVKLGLWLTAGFAVVCSVSALLCPFVVPLLFGEDYRGAVRVAQLLLLVPAVAALGSSLELHLKAHARVRELYVLHVIKPLSSAALLPVALVVWGLVGVGIEALVIAALYTLLTAWLVLGRRAAAVPAPRTLEVRT